MLANDDVAVVPKYAVPAENSEELALVNCWRPVQLFACVTSSESVAVPPRETGEPETVRPPPFERVMEEFASWLLPIVEVETKEVPLYESS